MTRNDSPSSKSPEVRVLSETEIQTRLYGRYQGWRRAGVSSSSPVSAPAMAPAEPSPSFSVEVIRLQLELTALRQEREILQAKLQEVSTCSASSSPVVTSSQGQGSSPRWVRVFGILLLLGIAGYLGGVRMLQASPSLVGDAAPYTVQVAVYDAQGPAQRSVQNLRRLQYDAFLVDWPRMDGRPSYRVYVGSFVTKEEADLEETRLAQDARIRDFKDAFVRFR